MTTYQDKELRRMAVRAARVEKGKLIRWWITIHAERVTLVALVMKTVNGQLIGKEHHTAI